MKRRLAILLVWTAMTASVAAARADEAYDQCKAAANADLGVCGEAWLAREQSALDAKWTSIIDLTDGAVADTLANEHTAWTAFKDASCAFMHDTAFAPGGDKASYYGCRASVIADRSRELDGYMSYIDN